MNRERNRSPNGIANDVMNDAVPEISGPYFTDLRIIHDEGQAAADLISAVLQFAIKLDQVRFKAALKPQLIKRVPLAATAIEIGIKDGIERELRRKAFFAHE